jgi:hypothetical protein
MSLHWNPRVVFLAGALCALPFGRAAGQAQGEPQGHGQGEAQGEPQEKAEGEPHPSGGAAEAKPPATGDEARAALKEMSSALASAKTLHFQVHSFVPVKAPSGDWVTLIGKANVMREGNDKLFVEAGGDLFSFRLFYDGKTVTAFAPDKKVYAQQEAPPTIDEALERAAKNGQATFAFRDLVSSDPYTAMTKGLKSAAVVGTSTVDGVETQHLVVHGKQVNWEIWIGTKDRLPRMVTLTDPSDARKPTHTLQFSEWAVDDKVPFRNPGQRLAARRGQPAKQH